MKVFSALFVSLASALAVQIKASSNATPSNIGNRNGTAPYVAPASEDGPRLMIVNGNVAKHGEYRFMVSLQSSNAGWFKHYCGGTLISEDWILSAAHCAKSGWVSRPGRVLVSPFKFDKKSVESDNLVFERKVKKVILHPKYTGGALYDVVLMQLDKPVKNVPVIVLANKKADAKVGKSYTVAGWGYIEQSSGVASNQLRETHVAVVSNAQCQTDYTNRYDIQPSQVCAGGDGRTDSCSGDSGGPLFSKVKNQYIQIGVVSRGKGCADKGFPGIYTRVSYYREWIASYVKRLPSPGGNGNSPTQKPVSSPTIRPSTVPAKKGCFLIESGEPCSGNFQYKSKKYGNRRYKRQNMPTIRQSPPYGVEKLTDELWCPAHKVGKYNLDAKNIAQVKWGRAVCHR